MYIIPYITRETTSFNDSYDASTRWGREKGLFLKFFFLSGVGLIQMEVSGSCVLSLLSLSFKKLIAMHAMRRGKGETYDSKKKKKSN